MHAFQLVKLKSGTMKRLVFILALFVQLNTLFCQNNLFPLYLKIQQGDSKGVIETLFPIAKDTTFKDIETLLLLGDAYKFQYDYKNALLTYQRVLKYSDKDVKALESISDINSILGEPQKSISGLETLLSLDSLNYRIAFKLVLAYQSNYNLRNAITLCRKIYNNDSSNYNTSKTLGDCYRMINNNDSSIYFYKKADRINGKSIYTKLMISRILYDFEDYPTARIYASRGLFLDSTSLQLRKQYANCCYKIKDYKGALPELIYLVNQGDSSSSNQRLIGACLFFLGNYEICIPWFQKSMEHDELNGQTLFYLGSALYQTGRYDEALECLQKGYEITRPDPEVVYIITNQLGLVYNGLKKYENAFLAFSQAYENKPGEVNLLYQMAMMKGLQQGNNNLSIAKDLLEKYLNCLNQKQGKFSNEDQKMKKDAELYLEKIKEELFMNSK